MVQAFPRNGSPSVDRTLRKFQSNKEAGAGRAADGYDQASCGAVGCDSAWHRLLAMRWCKLGLAWEALHVVLLLPMCHKADEPLGHQLVPRP